MATTDNFIELKIAGITFSQVQAGAYALILAEENGNRRIPIIIGTPEAQSIAIYLEGLNPPRPLTHDLFVAFAHTLNATLNQVNIYKYDDGIFYSELIYMHQGDMIRLDSRTSDAIALAIRTGAQIFIKEEIMQQVSIFMADSDILDDVDLAIDNGDKKNLFSFDSMSLDELQNKLEESVANEDYEQASFLRDLIRKRK